VASKLPLLYDEIHEFTRYDDCLYQFAGGQILRHVSVGFGCLGQFVVGRVDRQNQARSQLAVNLNDHYDQIVLNQLGVIVWPSR